MPYYILMQLEDNGEEIVLDENGEETDEDTGFQPRGSIWSTSIPAKWWKEHPHDSFEKYLQREKAEVLLQLRSYSEVSKIMKQWWNYSAKFGGSMDVARFFFSKYL